MKSTFCVTMRSQAGIAHLYVDGSVSEEFPQQSVFNSLDSASKFLNKGRWATPIQTSLGDLMA